MQPVMTFYSILFSFSATDHKQLQNEK